MTQDNDDQATESQDESNSEQDSGVIQSLREQIKELNRELKRQPSRSEIEAEVQEKLTRNFAIDSMLGTLGHPAGIRSVVAEQLGDADVTLESVTEALTAIGYTVEVGDGASSQEDEATANAADLADVSNLSARVRSAAKGATVESITDRIAKAKSREELQALAAEGEFLQNNY